MPMSGTVDSGAAEAIVMVVPSANVKAESRSFIVCPFDGKCSAVPGCKKQSALLLFGTGSFAT